MKIRNIAFCGVMASILTGWGALADTIIASKAYVDARDDTKQDSAKRVTTTWANTTAADKADDTKYPSMVTLDTAVSNLSTAISTDALTTNVMASDMSAADQAKLTKASAIRAAADTGAAVTVSSGVATTSTDDTKFATKGAVGRTIAALDGGTTNTTTNASSVVTAVTQTDGLVNVTTGTLGVGAITDAVAKQGSLAKAWNEEFSEGDANTAHATNLYKAVDIDEETNENHMDDYVPTMAAVEKRVQVAQAAAIQTAGSNVQSVNTNALAQDDANNSKLTQVSAIKGMKAVGEVATQSNGTVTITAVNNETDDNHVPTALTVKNDMDTLATAINAKLNKNTAITAKNNSIVNYDANGLVTGGVVFEDASGGLTGVNGETAGNMNCSTTNPCVLTYLGGTGAQARYRWTAMDTESVTAQ